MKTRVFVTNGKRTGKLLWIEHTGSDVYYEGYGTKGHRTYHASGEHHHTAPSGEHTNTQMRAPLESIEGVVFLTAFSFINRSSFLNSPAFPEYSPAKARSKAEAILLIDSRALPNDRQITVWIGLLEPGNGSALGEILEKRKSSDTMHDSHLLLAMSVTPWVWALVSWVSDSWQQQIEDLKKHGSGA